MRHAGWIGIALLLLVGCSDDASDGAGGAGGGGTGGSGTTSTTSGAGGGGLPDGDCDTNADCNGGECLAMTPGGYRVCTSMPTEATSCTDPQLDECCTTADCAFGKCFHADLPCCGGACQPLHNTCFAAQCFGDADCTTGSICLPAGLGYARSCMVAACKVAADCTAEPGGVCAPVANACPGCGGGLYCVYPSDGCRSNADCPGGYCGVDGDTARCMSGSVNCPG